MKKLLRFVLAFSMLLPMFTFASEWDKARLALSEPTSITVYRDANCQCCHHWIVHLEKHGFDVIDMLSNNMTMVKQQLGLPAQMASCHTAVVGDYLIEGHVPAEEIKQLLRDQPADIKGLSVPQMPVGTPGMEMGERKDNFIVFSFSETHDIEVYNAYQTDTDNLYQPVPLAQP